EEGEGVVGAPHLAVLVVEVRPVQGGVPGQPGLVALGGGGEAHGALRGTGRSRARWVDRTTRARRREPSFQNAPCPPAARSARRSAGRRTPMAAAPTRSGRRVAAWAPPVTLRCQSRPGPIQFGLPILGLPSPAMRLHHATRGTDPGRVVG